MAKIPFPTTWDVENPKNNGINFQPQLVKAGFQPSTTSQRKWCSPILCQVWRKAVSRSHGWSSEFPGFYGRLGGKRYKMVGALKIHCFPKDLIPFLVPKTWGRYVLGGEGEPWNFNTIVKDPTSLSFYRILTYSAASPQERRIHFPILRLWPTGTWRYSMAFPPHFETATKLASLMDIFPEFFQTLPLKRHYTPGKPNVTMETTTIWRCISY